MIKLFVYQRSDGLLVYESLGTAKYVIYDILPEHDFTLTPPPDYDHVWRWIDDKWIADNTAE